MPNASCPCSSGSPWRWPARRRSACIALARGETISAAWLVVAAVCTYLGRLPLLLAVHRRDGLRARPAARDAGRAAQQRPRLRARRPSGCSSATTSRPSPARARWSGRRWRRSSASCPGTIWLIVGVVLGGAVQDFVILCASMRRDGKSLGQIAKEEVNPVAGMAGMVAIFAIMIILLAVLALVVVNALRDSPWGLFTISCTIPIALLMGMVDERRCGPGKVGEATVHRARAAARWRSSAASGCRRARRGARRSPGRARASRGR